MSTTRDPTKIGNQGDRANSPGARAFAAPRKSLEALDALGAAALIEAASDIALVLDRRGVIQDISVSLDDLAPESYAGWLGRPWSEVVTLESRTKVESLLDDAVDGAPRRWRHINHPLGRGADLPVLYSTVRLGTKGRVVAFGRDLRALSSLQQRLVDAQHTLERDYWRLRHVETRYRLLFDMASEALLIVDAATSKVVEANPAALEQLGLPARRVTGQAFPLGLPDKGLRDVTTLISQVRSTGRSDEVRVRGAQGQAELMVGATLFTQEDTKLLLVRMRSARVGMAAAPAPAGRSAILQVVERATDGFVVTDFDGRVLLANPSFVELTQQATEEQVRGQTLDRWLGRPGVDLSVLLATLRQQGSVRLFATSLRGEHGAQADVEISAVAVPEGEPPCMGFTVRHVGRRLGVDLQAGKAAPRSVEQLTQLVGRMPLKDLVRESTDLIEQLCIEAALKLTQDNRASAAEMLGLSRQSLYVKLRRYGLGDLGADSER
ncbi:transcriptional regulator PpsR [Ideonella sp. A 288]|uniref:transcriptional regulator PpsR n=1 Tax=Ideonella sp. A 288 TaxID=1962181 RepID=UPI001F417520|nr:transcriptional regulator PpsR [Ideonella sp. A 288]